MTRQHDSCMCIVGAVCTLVEVGLIVVVVVLGVITKLVVGVVVG